MLGTSQHIEIIVVDNNSTDNTRAVIESFSPKLHGLKYVFEKSQGLSHARNAGIKASTGEVCVFIDDDIKLCDGFIDNLHSVLERNEHIYAFGGRVIPDWGGLKRPEWLGPPGDRSITKGPLGDHDFGDKEEFYGEGGLYSFVGGNFIVYRFLLDEVGPIRTDLGVSGNTRLLGEETDLYFRIREKGYSVLHVPSVRVFHPVTESQLHKEYFRKWYEACGKSMVMMKPDFDSKQVFRVPRYFFHKLASAWIKSLMFALAGNAFKTFYWDIQVCYL